MFLIDLLTLELEVCELRAMVSQQAQEITGLQSTVRSMNTEVDNIKDTVQTVKHKLNVSHHSPFIPSSTDTLSNILPQESATIHTPSLTTVTPTTPGTSQTTTFTSPSSPEPPALSSPPLSITSPNQHSSVLDALNCQPQC